jgi:hypothetical protein
VYLGEADGTDLRLIAEDQDGNWTTVESFATEATPLDHLFIAAWEAPSDYGGPQMVIAEAETPTHLSGTSATTFEWALGPAGDCPGVTPPDPAPESEALSQLVAEAIWEFPAVEAPASSDPWGWAVSAAFAASTQYIWADTFGDTSVTNTSNTYALFRSLNPVIGSAGSTEISGSTTTVFRTEFSFDHDPATAKLFASCAIDDGAVFYLNGAEVLRENMPAGPVSADTLALAEITSAEPISLEIPTFALLQGKNVLSVEVHQASPDDEDLLFGCALSAQIFSSFSTPTIVLNELAPADTSPFWVELQNISSQTQDTSKMILASSSGDEQLLSGELEPGALDLVELEAMEAGEILFLYTADRSRLLDAVRVAKLGRGRAQGKWWVETETTPLEENVIESNDDIVINEIMYHRAEQAEEWVELYNRGTTVVDLSGWKLVDAVGYVFPEGTVLEPDAYLVVEGFEGELGNEQDHIVLLDALGNTADEVEYFEGGRWPVEADGGGSSLELINFWTDNNVAESWAASDEITRSIWTFYEIQGVADPSAVGPDGVWNEWVLGLLDAGEVLIDDIHVVQDPETNPVEILQNGSFDNLDHWRLLGNHRHSELVPDPDDPSNNVLRLVATGPTEHMHNHLETTLTQTISTRTYKISFRARWVSGSNQLNSRLYFNRLPRTILLEQPESSGTPGAANSRFRENTGPVFKNLRQDIAVPMPGQPAEIQVEVADPDGVAQATLWFSVDGGAFIGQVMTEEEGSWKTSIAGQAAGAVVQFYVEAEDQLGERAFFPAAGPDSRALFQVDDGKAASNGLHNFRLIMTQADSDWLLEDTNLMSNDLLGATVVYEESEVFYNVGVRTKGSERGRPETLRLGYGVQFNPEALFRGSLSSVLIDRSEGVIYGQREFLLNLVMMRAGLVSAEYNDLTQVITPCAEHTGAAELQLDRSTGLVLDAQFEDGSAGSLYDYELIYYPYTTEDGTAEGLKLPQPDSVIGTSLTNLGSDKEAYRWNFMLQNNTQQDSYEPLIALNQTFALRGSPEFLETAGDIIDIDAWMQAFAVATLAGAVDNYGGDSSQHNARFYARPEDGKILYFPHDLDFFGSYNMAVVGNSDLWYLIQDPDYHRLYYQHLQDILTLAYNLNYLGPWCEQLGTLLPNQDFNSHCQFIADRASYVETDASDSVLQQYPAIDFNITTNNGSDFTSSDASVLLSGQGWVDVHSIRLNGQALDVSWQGQSWQITVPLQAGPNTIALQAVNLGGSIVGTDTIQITYQ